jgi:hypothetical protein
MRVVVGEGTRPTHFGQLKQGRVGHFLLDDRQQNTQLKAPPVACDFTVIGAQSCILLMVIDTLRFSVAPDGG